MRHSKKAYHNVCCYLKTICFPQNQYFFCPTISWSALAATHIFWLITVCTHAQNIKNKNAYGLLISHNIYLKILHNIQIYANKQEFKKKKWINFEDADAAIRSSGKHMFLLKWIKCSAKFNHLIYYNLLAKSY